MTGRDGDPGRVESMLGDLHDSAATCVNGLKQLAQAAREAAADLAREAERRLRGDTGEDTDERR